MAMINNYANDNGDNECNEDSSDRVPNMEWLHIS